VQSNPPECADLEGSRAAGVPSFVVADAVCSHTAPWVFNGGEGLRPSRAQEHGKMAFGLSRLALCASKLGMRALSFLEKLESARVEFIARDADPWRLPLERETDKCRGPLMKPKGTRIRRQRWN
jgi:hypothetical protein